MDVIGQLQGRLKAIISDISQLAEKATIVFE